MGLFATRTPPNRGDRRSMTWGDLQAIITTSSGTQITVENALRCGAAWGCVDALASPVSETPVDVIDTRGGTRKVVDVQPPVVQNPSAVSMPDVWRYQLVESMATDGNGFGQIVDYDDRTSLPTQIELLNAIDVRDRKVVDGIPQVTINQKIHKLFPHGDIWHVPGRMVRAGSPFGLSPLTYASTSIKSSLEAENFGAQFFTGGGHPDAVIYSEDPDLNAEKALKIKEAFLDAVRGREPGVFGSGLKYETIQASPQDSQFIDLMRFEVEQTCRFFRVPPAAVYAAVSGQNVTYSNLSQADLHYLKRTTNTYLVRIENAYQQLLPPRFIYRANRNAILRSTPKERWEIHKVRLELRTTSINEVRVLEDEEPFDDPLFDMPGIPEGIDVKEVLSGLRDS